MNETTVIVVNGADPYEVVVGRGLLSGLAAHIGSLARKVLIVHPATMAVRAERLRETLRGDYEVLLAEIPDAEAGKRIEVAAFCWQILGKQDFTRTDVVIGFGGGATTDLAGFVAANWLRGVRVIQIPTSLVGMVDAAIGGKTGVNTAEGKNLVGAFHAPAAVIVDLDALAGLPRNELLAGFGEVVKCGFIAEPEILDLIEADAAEATNPESDRFRRIVELSIGIKARVVGEDFKETGPREILNYGHTLGHAIEYTERFQWRHGAAVAVGMVYAAELALLTGHLSADIVDRHRSILTLLELPTGYSLRRWDSLLAAMQRDKKTRGSTLRFIVLDGLARPAVLTGPDPSLLFAAYQEIAT